MLSTLGLSSVADLFNGIPNAFRYPALSLPQPLTELEALQSFHELASRNQNPPLSFVGGGAYRHFIPSVVPYLSSRGEFATSYTPYQAEVSQGTLQAIYEYQSMVADLLGMDVVNASHYDGATALAEAVIMSMRASRDSRKKIILSAAIHPLYREVIRTYLQGMTGVTTLFTGDIPNPHDGALSAAELAELVDENTASLVVAWPDFFGRMLDLNGLAEKVHEKGALLIVHTNPIALGIYRSPGSFGADIVTAEGQPLGIPLSFGGPYLGIFACREALVRRMPGRLVGETVDRDGRRGYVLTLSTREQHIRREKATSNICTNQGLMALRAAIYLSAVGKHGLRAVSEICSMRAEYAARKIAAIPGFSVADVKPALGALPRACRANDRAGGRGHRPSCAGGDRTRNRSWEILFRPRPCSSYVRDRDAITSRH